MSLQDTLQQLRQGDVWARYRAAEQLGREEPTQEVLLALVAALADEGEFEEPGDIGAPPFYFHVGVAARHSLGSRSGQVLGALAEQMKTSRMAAQQGARLLPLVGTAATPLLVETLKGEHEWGRASAVQEVGKQLALSPELNPELMRALLNALADPSGEVAYSARNEVGHLLKKHRRLNLSPWIGEGLLARLIQQERWEALDIFSQDPRVLEAWLDLAVTGDARTCDLLLNQVDRLDEAAVARLCAGQPSLALIRLLSQLEQRADATLPWLQALGEDRERGPMAKVAVLRISQGRIVPPGLTDLFMEKEDYRNGLVRFHPQPAEFARELFPRLRDRWEKTEDNNAWRGLKVLAPWLVEQLEWLRTHLGRYPRSTVARSYAVEIIGTFGQAAAPAFEQMAVLLDDTEARGGVLKALTSLGPVAREDFLVLLEVMHLESRRWLTWQKNYWSKPLDEALAALRK